MPRSAATIIYACRFMPSSDAARALPTLSACRYQGARCRLCYVLCYAITPLPAIYATRVFSSHDARDAACQRVVDSALLRRASRRLLDIADMRRQVV